MASPAFLRSTSMCFHSLLAGGSPTSGAPVWQSLLLPHSLLSAALVAVLQRPARCSRLRRDLPAPCQLRSTHAYFVVRLRQTTNNKSNSRRQPAQFVSNRLVMLPRCALG